jgi:hypothetical protein
VVGVAWAPKGAKIMVGGKGAIESEEGVLICKVLVGRRLMMRVAVARASLPNMREA